MPPWPPPRSHGWRWNSGCHYLDIFEDTGAAAQVAALAGGAGPLCLAPGCGLAPGYVTALTAELLAGAGAQSETTVFVGVLPAKRENRLGYANIWGIDGLLDEYTNPCLVVEGGALAEVAPLIAYRGVGAWRHRV